MADVEPVNDINENVEDEQNCVPARQQGKGSSNPKAEIRL